MTLILQTSAPITAPIFPSLIEIDPDLALLFRGQDLSGFADGAEVAAFVARGQGDVRTRTFDFRNTGWSFPHFSAGPGRQSLRFDGGHHITDFASANSYPSFAQPATVLAAFRTDAFGYSSTTYARILGGGTTTANSWAIRPTNVAGQLSVGAGASTALVSSSLAAGLWGVIGVVFNGAASRIISPSGVIAGASLESIPLAGVRIGGNSNPAVTGTQGFIGNVSDARIYTRALSDAELLATWQAMGGGA